MAVYNRNQGSVVFGPVFVAHSDQGAVISASRCGVRQKTSIDRLRIIQEIRTSARFP